MTQRRHHPQVEDPCLALLRDSEVMHNLGRITHFWLEGVAGYAGKGLMIYLTAPKREADCQQDQL